MKNVYKTATDFLQKGNIRFHILEEGIALMAFFSGTNGNFRLIIRTIEAREVIVMDAEISVKAPVAKRADVSEYINRINGNLLIGSFQIDMDDGEVIFRVVINLEGIEMDCYQLLRNSLQISINEADDNLPGILSVIYTNISPKDALNPNQRGDIKSLGQQISLN